MENSSMAGSWEGITSVEADGYDIIIHMDNGYSASISFQLSSVMMPIVCAEDIDNLSIDELYWNARIYGSYYVDEFVQGDHVTLKANPYYKTNNPNIENQGKPYVDTVVIRFMTDNFAIVQGLLAGEIDIANSYLTVENLPELNAADNLVVTVAKNAGIYSFIINPKNELFADENVRKALALLITAICSTSSPRRRSSPPTTSSPTSPSATARRSPSGTRRTSPARTAPRKPWPSWPRPAGRIPTGMASLTRMVRSSSSRSPSSAMTTCC